MGRAACAGAVAAVLMTAGLPAPSPASVLNQIESANDVAAQQESALQVPVLRKHYLEVAPGVLFAVKGERERRQVRYARLIKSLSGDRLEVYEREGFPTFRHRELETGVLTEHWTYAGKQVTYVFRGNRLVSVVPF